MIDVINDPAHLYKATEKIKLFSSQFMVILLQTDRDFETEIFTNVCNYI